MTQMPKAETLPDTERKSAFARRLDVTRQYIDKLSKMGLPLTENGQVRVKDALAWMEQNITSANGDDEPTDLVTARIRLVTANAKRAEWALEIERGRYVLKEEVRTAARGFGRAHRDQMLNFASRYGAGIAAAAGCDAATLIGLIDAKMREALQESLGIPVPFHSPNDPELDDNE